MSPLRKGSGRTEALAWGVNVAISLTPSGEEGQSPQFRPGPLNQPALRHLATDTVPAYY
jgi:hypothetical protein